MKRYNLLAISLILIASTYSQVTKATDLDVSAGISHYVDGEDGFWYQEDFPHHFNFNSLAFATSFHDTIKSYGNFDIGWKAGWNYAGKMSMQSYTTSDAGYNTSTHKCISGCDTPSNFEGKGHDQGFVFAPTFSYTVAGITGELNFGPYVHLNTWSEHVTPPSGAEHDAEATQRWIVGRELGITLRSGKLFMSYQFLQNKNHFAGSNVSQENFPAAWHATHMLTFGYTF